MSGGSGHFYQKTRLFSTTSNKKKAQINIYQGKKRHFCHVACIPWKYTNCLSCHAHDKVIDGERETVVGGNKLSPSSS